MNKRIIHRYALLIAGLPLLAMLTACDKVDVIDQRQQPTTVGDLVPLQLASGISVSVTRAYDSTWDNGDQIGVFATTAGTTTITTSGATQTNGNIPYTIATGGETWVSNANSYLTFSAVDKNIYLPADGSNIDVYAYYPYHADVSATTPRSITIPDAQNSAEQVANLKACDVLTAKRLSTDQSPVNIDNTTAQLLFSHVLSKVLIKIKLGTGVNLTDIQGKVNSVIITGQPTSGTFAPLTQTLTISTEEATVKTITPKLIVNGDPEYESYDATGTIHAYRALLMPNNDTTNPASPSTVVTGEGANPHLITFSVGDNNVPYHYPITYALRSGYQTTFTITFGASGIRVDAAIQPWTADGATGVISPEDPELEP